MKSSKIFSALLSGVIFVLFLSNILVGQPQKRNLETRVTVSQGDVEGVNDSGILIFRGIPFAEPPVGDSRWAEPQDKEAWDGVLDATVFGPSCMQNPVFGDMNFRADGMSEDCLYLNIWTPAKSADANLPVLLYYYGGGFMAGDGSEPRYDGASMARNHGIVAITTNYRLGAFGFFAHAELTKESPNNASGNYGLLDQVKALEWVKENIAVFGGDPDNITIAGESAGSISVSALMASPLSRDHLAGAIGESGSILGALPPVPLEVGEENGQKFAEIIGASSLEELRAIPADTLLAATAQQGLPRFAPTVDGYYFPKPPLEIFGNGEQADIPLFVGWNSQEMNYRFLMGQEEPTPENYAARVRQLYPDNANRILELYPGSTKAEVLQSATDLAGDRFIALSTWKWGDIHAETGTSPVYRYYFTKPRPPMTPEYADSRPGFAGGVQEGESDEAREESEEQIQEPNGAVHSAEIEYMMGNLASNEVYAWTETDYKVSNIFQNFAANFIKKKTPNGLGVPFWPAVNPENDEQKVMSVGSKTYLLDDLHSERYLFLDRLTYEN